RPMLLPGVVMVPVVGAARLATQDDAATATEIIVGAFYDDPTWSWAFPDPARRREQHRLFWRAYVDGALRFPGVWLTPGDTATSVWIPPGETELTPEGDEAVERMLVELLGDDSERVFRAFELFEKTHPHDEPHYYLSLLATDPAQRGHGYGLALLEANLAAIDAERMPAYLEASNPANVPLYERYGFRVVDAFDLPDDGPRVHTMWRDAVAL
ncbi:MAG TPA: GNAT family N-acetyltransferase, partial [Ilumatobacteraceae bacterium]|nr:GNAT family N-acetyltransferase [Ilumatobacteraceae bacterium]